MVLFDVIRGDITTLKIEAIVNASHENGLGCNIPGHCIDTAIHACAVSQLLEECRKLGGIPTGIAKITPGFNLPCKYVIHVTEPRAPQSGLVEECDFDMLSKSYIACLELAQVHYDPFL